MRRHRLPNVTACLSFILMLCIKQTCLAGPKPIKILAAENFYGAIAKNIGGKYVQVRSILNSPNADPHLFSTSPETSIAIAKADIIIYNGMGYDSWMSSLLKTRANKAPTTINVSKLIGGVNTSNPHIWYNPATFPVLAKHLARVLMQAIHLPKASATIANNLQHYLEKNKIVQSKVKSLQKKYHGLTVAATEPVFGYMAQAIGLNIKGRALSQNIMNDASPSPKTLQQFENLLIKQKVRLLFYNNQVTTPLTDHLRQLAKAHHIPIMGIAEIMPTQFQTTNAWLISALQQTGALLKKSNHHDD